MDAFKRNYPFLIKHPSSSISSKKQFLMINEIIKRAIRRFAFEAELLREVIN